MRDLNKITEECRQEIESIGITCGEVKRVVVNYRAKARWGQCKGLKGGGYEINISSQLMSDDVDIVALKTTVIHELLHTVKGTRGHTGLWKEYAELMNDTYGYNIKRCTPAYEKGITEEQRASMIPKYFIECTNCGLVYDYCRRTKIVAMFMDDPKGAHNRYRCGKCKKHSLIFSDKK